MVTTTLLESMVHDVSGGEIAVTALVPPGSCPGHYDLKPGDMAAIERASLFLRHDFQKSMDERVVPLLGKGAKTAEISCPGSLLVPGNYVEGARQVAEALEREQPGRRSDLRARLARLRDEMEEESRSILERMKAHSGKKVLCSERQEAFVRWLGLVPAGTFNTPADLRPGKLRQLKEAARKEGVVLVVGNLQANGEEAARVVAREVEAPVVVLSNFPGTFSSDRAYLALLRENVRRVIEALRD